AGAAIASSEDPLIGLKENVIIGKLIPAGTGFVYGRFNQAPAEAEVDVEEGEAILEGVEGSPVMDIDPTSTDLGDLLSA
ncbi:MAG: hypothetical protein U1B80_08650, partial [Anaerolineaceae bacterium]|nr:hypothetical protein [Anaerolineaceae bacterium]